MKTYENIKSKPCKTCGAPIGFVKTKKGKWLVVDVFNLNGEEVTCKKHNMYPLHKCACKNIQSSFYKGE